MKNLRKYRLVYACLNCLGGLLRLAAALVGMASNYSWLYGSKVGHEVPA